MASLKGNNKWRFCCEYKGKEPRDIIYGESKGQEHLEISYGESKGREPFVIIMVSLKEPPLNVYGESKGQEPFVIIVVSLKGKNH